MEIYINYGKIMIQLKIAHDKIIYLLTIKEKYRL